MDEVGPDRAQAAGESEGVRQGVDQGRDRQAIRPHAILAQVTRALAHRQHLHGDAGGAQSDLVHEQRVTGLPRGQFLRGPVALGVALVVAVPPVGGRLHEHRPPSGPHPGHDVRHGGGCGDA